MNKTMRFRFQNYENIYTRPVLLTFLFFIVALATPSVSRASHIVGGVIYYRFIERPTPTTVRFEFTLLVYRDSSSTSQFDSNPSIGIHKKLAGQTTYNTANSVYFTTPLLSMQRVEKPSYPCLTPPNVGVEEGLYRFTRDLTDDGSDFTIVYQRCCRNTGIANIRNSSTTGASYTVEIKAAAIAGNNSSPVFNVFPPTVICANQPLNFNHSATDIDGDQIVYSFCDAYIGASSGSANPTRPTAPPYTAVTYVTPTYTSTIPVLSNPTIRINPVTGIITGTPTTVGRYIVTVCMAEYRNGELLTKVSRDFQFNIESCQRTIVAQMISDSIRNKTNYFSTCSLKPLTIRNTSYQRASIFNLTWTFNRGTDTLRYTDWEPTVVFPDTGFWRGRMFLNPNTPCSDSTEMAVYVGGKLDPDFDYSYDTCVAGPVTFNGSLAGRFPITNTMWRFGDGKIDTVNLAPALHKYDSAGVKRVRLIGRDIAGCLDSIEKTFEWRPAPSVIIVEPSRFVGCEPAKVTFINRSMPIDTTYKVLWDFGDSSGIVRSINAEHLYPKAGSYNVKVMITSPFNCYKEATFKNWIKVNPNPTANFTWSPKSTTILKPEYFFEDSSSSDAVSWRWTFSNQGSSIKENPSFYFRDTGSYKIWLYITNQFGCRDSISKSVHIEPEVRFYMPNAFSPNNDTNNDELKGTGFTYGLKDFGLKVWNRWGELIFETTDINEGWNGQKNNTGDPAPQGIYLYEYHFTSPNGKVVTERQFVTLYR